MQNTIKKFLGTYTLVIYDPGMPPSLMPHTMRLPQRVNLCLSFTDGVISPDSKTQLQRMIAKIKSDIQHADHLISAHWFEGKIDYQEINEKGTIVDSRTFPTTTINQLGEFISYLEDLAASKRLDTMSTYTPLLHKSFEPAQKETDPPIRSRKFFRCCFG